MIIGLRTHYPCFSFVQIWFLILPCTPTHSKQPALIFQAMLIKVLGILHYFIKLHIKWNIFSLTSFILLAKLCSRLDLVNMQRYITKGGETFCIIAKKPSHMSTCSMRWSSSWYYIIQCLERDPIYQYGFEEKFPRLIDLNFGLCPYVQCPLPKSYFSTSPLLFP